MKLVILSFSIALTTSMASASPPCTADDIRSLRRMTACEWETLFRNGKAECLPLGTHKGVILEAEGSRLKARLQGLVWKGKDFDGNGTMINRWTGFRAVTAEVSHGTSWLDGQACIVLQYAQDAKIFPGVRDELRQIGPGLWLGRGYDGTKRTHTVDFILQTR